MKPRIVILLLALAALAAKLYCATTTLGTNDTVAFFVFGKELSEHSLAEMYRTPIFNHTPLVAAYLSTIYELAPHSDQAFALLLRLPGIFADFIVVLALLWLREKGPRVPWWALGLFALSPVSFMVSGFHGNVDSVMVLFLVLAACAVVAGQPGLCGLACAFACHVKAAPLLLLPVFAAHWWERRRLWPFAGIAAAMIVLGWIEPLLTVPQLFAKNVLSYGGYWFLLNSGISNSGGTFSPYSSIHRSTS